MNRIYDGMDKYLKQNDELLNSILRR